MRCIDITSIQPGRTCSRFPLLITAAVTKANKLFGMHGSNVQVVTGQRTGEDNAAGIARHVARASRAGKALLLFCLLQDKAKGASAGAKAG
jgi:hypothetical protein